MKITDITIQQLKPSEKQVVYYDDAVPNFGVRVGKRSKTFIVKLGKTRTIKSIGRYPQKSLKVARNEAKALLLVRDHSTANTPYSDAVEEFLAEVVTRNRPETVRQYKRHLDAFDSKKKLGDVSRADIKAHLLDYKDTPAAYVHAVAGLRVFFNWCIRQELMDKHPLAGERLTPVKSRETVLTLEQLREIYGYNFPPFSTILKLCLLTGQRRTEIASIAPEWIVDDCIVFPSTITKNRRTHVLPMTETIKELIQDVPFGKNGAFNGWSNGKRRIDKNLNIGDWQIHDLRRSFSTYCAAAGVPIHITERILNHATGTITPIAQVYNRYDYKSEMKEALVQLEAFVLES